jgi:CHAD domain-containing protein
MSPDAPLWQWAYDSLSHRAETMLSHLDGVREGEDIEAVHDMRVWSRRLVASMKVFHACFPDDDFRTLYREARSVTRRLGAVRDLDVLLDHFKKLRETAGPEECLGLEYLIALKSRERGKARRPMLRALDELASSHYSRRVQRYLHEQAEAYEVGLGPAAVRGARTGGVAPEGPFREAGPPLLSERYEEFYSWEAYVPEPECEFELHEMRIGAKWLRYTMELFAPAYADELKSTLGVVKKFQELLGDLHDSDVRRQIYGETLKSRLDARAVVDMGLLLPDAIKPALRRLAAQEEQTRAEYYRLFFKEWQKQARKEFKTRLRERLERPDAPTAGMSTEREGVS